MGWNWKCPVFSFNIMLVLDDIVLLWTGTTVMATHTDHRQPVKQSILTQLLFCWRTTWLNNGVTEQYGSCHAFSLFEPYGGTRWNRHVGGDAASVKCRSSLWINQHSTLGLFMCMYVCAAHCYSQNSRITEGKEKSEGDSTEREAELRGRTVGSCMERLVVLLTFAAIVPQIAG